MKKPELKVEEKHSGDLSLEQILIHFLVPDMSKSSDNLVSIIMPRQRGAKHV